MRARARFIRMTLILLAPTIIAFYLVWRGRSDVAFLSVFLPCLLLLPQYYVYRLPHLPPLSTAELASVPIGAASLGRFIKRRSFVLGDLFVFGFLVGIILSETLREPSSRFKDGFQISIESLVCPMLVYVIGRELVEPSLRLLTVKRIIILVLLLIPFALVEWRLGQSIYGLLGEKLFGFPYVGVQRRANHGRAVMAFNDAEIAGIICGMFMALNAWLVYLNKKQPAAKIFGFLSTLEQFHIPAILLLGALVLTQARGPLIAVAAAYVILQITRFKSVRVGTLVVALVLGGGGYLAYRYFQNYSATANAYGALDERDTSVLYRRDMHKLYAPIVEKGGWLGWGLLGHPKIKGLSSADDEFLLVQLGQGKFGLLTFVLMEIESFRYLLFQLWKAQTPDDRAFICSMIAALAVFWISITTVYMGEQLPQVAFLLIGWSFSIVPGRAASAAGPQAVKTKFALGKVLQ
jgi:hypothetical protein